MRYNDRSILEALLSLSKVLSSFHNELFIKLISQLVEFGFVYNIDNVLQNFCITNIYLYMKIKKILRIPNLTYDNLLLDSEYKYSSEYITYEIYYNSNLIQEINENRNDKGQSLLYIYCSFKLTYQIFSVLRVNEISKRFLIDVNIKNTESESTPLHGLLWHGINNVKNGYMINAIINLLKRNNLNINIKNKHNLTPIQELDSKKDISEQVKDEIKKKLLS
jgi:hypothetical protein